MVQRLKCGYHFWTLEIKRERGGEGKGVMVTIFNIFKPFFNSILANPTHPNPSKDKVSSETNSITKRGAKKREKI